MLKTCRLAAAVAVLSAGAAFAEDPVRIGALVPLSGPASTIGQGFERGLKSGLASLEDGKIAGRSYELIVYDSEGSSSKGAQLFRRLVESDKVDVVIGPSLSGEALAIAPLANEFEVVTITSAGAAAVTTPPTPYVYGGNVDDAKSVAALLDLFKERNLHKVALIYSADGYGQSGGKAIQERAAGHGIDLVSVETFNAQDLSVAPQLINAQAAKPEALLIWANNPGPILVLKGLAELGIELPTFITYANTTNAFSKQAGAPAEGVHAVALARTPEMVPEGDPRRPILEKLQAEYQKQFNDLPDLTSGLGFDAALILDAALRKVDGPVTREAIRDAMQGLEVCLSTGCIAYSETDHRGHKTPPLALVTMDNGNWVAVK